MPAIASPTLLIYAETGGTVTADDAAEITSLIPDSRAVRIDGVGHMIPWDDLETFVGIIENFLRKVG